MKKYAPIISKALIIACLWTACIVGIAQQYVKTLGVNPTFPYYNTLLEVALPTQAVFAHFDGAHYVHIAELGYDGTGVQAFFPLYPLLIQAVNEGIGLNYIESGRLLSFVGLLISLICLIYLYDMRAKRVMMIVLLFPTSFFLAMVYTESLFLAQVLIFFVCLKRKSYLLAAVIAGCASATRLIGAALAISLLIELYHHPLSITRRSLLTIISLSGLGAYMYYLTIRYNDPLMFLHVQSLFGAERSSGEIITLPQVLIRYVRMIITVDPATWLFQRVWIELLTFLAACWFWCKNLFKIPDAQSAFTVAAIILPTLSGTLSSFPRYTLVLLPFLIPQDNIRPRYLMIYLCLSVVLLLYLLSRFATGEFVS